LALKSFFRPRRVKVMIKKGAKRATNFRGNKEMYQKTLFYSVKNFEQHISCHDLYDYDTFMTKNWNAGRIVLFEFRPSFQKVKSSVI